MVFCAGFTEQEVFDAAQSSSCLPSPQDKQHFQNVTGCDTPGRALAAAASHWAQAALNSVVTLLNPWILPISSSVMSPERHRNGEASSGVDGQFFLVLMGTRYPKPVAMVALKIQYVTIKIIKNSNTRIGRFCSGIWFYSRFWLLWEVIEQLLETQKCGRSPGLRSCRRQMECGQRMILSWAQAAG